MTKLRTPPPDLSTNSNYAESVAAIIFFAFLKVDQVTETNKEVENDAYFKKLYKRYRDKIRRQLSHSIQQVSFFFITNNRRLSIDTITD
jgi:hypothetical protein